MFKSRSRVNENKERSITRLSFSRFWLPSLPRSLHPSRPEPGAGSFVFKTWHKKKKDLRNEWSEVEPWFWGGRGWAEEASRTKCFGIRIVPSAAEMYFWRSKHRGFGVHPISTFSHTSISLLYRLKKNENLDSTSSALASHSRIIARRWGVE